VDPAIKGTQFNMLKIEIWLWEFLVTWSLESFL